MRLEVTDRYYRVFTYQNVDRVPDIEFGYWPQTIRRWLKEGMKLDMTPEETQNEFSPIVDAHFGFEPIGYRLPIRQTINPPFEEKVIEKREHSTIMQGGDGCIAERFLHDQDESSIPHFIKFPVETPDDWKEIKKRFVKDDPVRAHKNDELDAARRAAADGDMITIGLTGPYGQLRAWMGFENLSIAFYEYPDMIRDMVEHWADLQTYQIETLPADIVIDHILWWEDMASKNGPFVSPKMFREVLQPGYRRVMTAAKKRGCCIALVDCDGNPHDIVGNWLEEGVNIMFPLEVAAGCDPYAWRKEFGKELRIRGGIAKVPLVQGGKAIDAELDRLKPLLDQGGFIPHLDHLVPPDIPYSHYCYYLEKKRRMIGK